MPSGGKVKKAAIIGIAAACSALTTPASAQDANIIVESLIQTGLTRGEAESRYALDGEARLLQERLRREEPAFAGMYGDVTAGALKVFVRLTGNANATLAKYTNNPAFVAVQAVVPLQALERRQEAIARSLAARGTVAGNSIDLRTGKVRVVTRDVAKAKQALTGAATDSEIDVQDDDVAPTPVLAVSGGRQATAQFVSGSTLYSDRTSLGFSVTTTNGATSGVVTAAHFGRCVNSSGATIAGCSVNGAAYYNPSNATGQLTGTPSLTFRSERLGGSYDVEWRTSTTDTFPNQIIYSTNTAMAITITYDPANFVAGSSRVCKQGFTTGYACGTFVEKYNMPWFGTYGDHYLVKSDRGSAMAAGGDSGGPVFLSNTAVGLISGVFADPASSRYNQMSFTSITTLSALGVTVETAP